MRRRRSRRSLYSAGLSRVLQEGLLRAVRGILNAVLLAHDMDMLLRSCLSIVPGVSALWPGPELLSNKVPCHVFSCSKGWYPSLHCQETKCFSLLASSKEDIGVQSSPMVVPEWGWPRPCDQLLLKGGSPWV